MEAWVSDTELPQALSSWFKGRGWQPRDYQLSVLQAVRGGKSVLLTAPTGGGKTLAGYLPSLSELIANDDHGAWENKLHTIY